MLIDIALAELDKEKAADSVRIDIMPSFNIWLNGFKVALFL